MDKIAGMNKINFALFALFLIFIWSYKVCVELRKGVGHLYEFDGFVGYWI